MDRDVGPDRIALGDLIGYTAVSSFEAKLLQAKGDIQRIEGVAKKRRKNDIGCEIEKGFFVERVKVDEVEVIKPICQAPFGFPALQVANHKDMIGQSMFLVGEIERGRGNGLNCVMRLNFSKDLELQSMVVFEAAFKSSTMSRQKNFQGFLSEALSMFGKGIMHSYER